MMFITKKHLSRHTMIQGMDVTVALPFLESMLPAMTLQSQSAASKPKARLACVEIAHRSAGNTNSGLTKNYWAPPRAGSELGLTSRSLLPLDPWKDFLTIVSNTDLRSAEAWELHEVGGDHFRSSAVCLPQSHPKQTEGSDVYSGTSFD